ncbi:MAG: N-acetyltransferase family protein [Pseudomonadota bacterium]
MTEVRLARLDDAEGINAVYNPFILKSPATFETEPISEASRRDWLAGLGADPRHPVVVAIGEGGKILGFANAARFDPRAAYGTSVKTSVFVSPQASGQGVGHMLYADLFERLAQCDLHRAYGLIVAPNPASVRLHEAFGFSHVSTLDEVGRKFDRYYSVMWFEKRL